MFCCNYILHLRRHIVFLFWIFLCGCCTSYYNLPSSIPPKSAPDLRLPPPHLRGTRASIRCLVMASRAHPRASEEHIQGHHLLPIWPGSPPRQLGKPDVLLVSSYSVRLTPRASWENSSHPHCTTTQLWLTPAPAGNTSRRFCMSGISRTHPRPRGEHQALGRMYRASSGSPPPPTQGTLLDVEGYRPGSRLTPAPAGNTWKSSQRFARDRAHPRACGEHGAQHDIISMPGGSSPRLRGTLSKPAIAQNLARLTPVAGYGRSRARGSPPPTRGKRLPYVHRFFRYRLTPAHAWKTY